LEGGLEVGPGKKINKEFRHGVQQKACYSSTKEQRTSIKEISGETTMQTPSIKVEGKE
jgi:hypothetical protein